MENILELNNLSIMYNESKTAVKHVNLNIPRNSIVAIVGESGSGKSTLIHAIMNLLPRNGRITTGEIIYRNRNIAEYSLKQMREIRGKGISMIFQDALSTLDLKKRIGDQYKEVLKAHFDISKIEAHRMAVDTLSQFAFQNPERIMKAYPFELSGGMIQRVAIAMSVSLKSDILLADEPTSALDVTVQAQVINTLMELHEKHQTTIMMVTHNLGVAAYMADYIIVMKDGIVVEMGKRDEIINHPQHAYTKMLLTSVPNMEVVDFAYEGCCN